MNTIVIDGYNLIHRVDELLEITEKDGFESARDQLERILSSYLAGRKGVRAVVVYDSSVMHGKATGKRSYPGVRVRFAPCADDLVVELAQKYAGERDHVRVVSSDRAGVGSPLAGERRIEVLSSDEFWSATLAAKTGRKIRNGTGAGSFEKADRLGQEKPSNVSPAEVEYWLQAFGETGKSEGQKEGPDKKSSETGQSFRDGEKGSVDAKEIKKRRYLRRRKRRR